MTMETIDDLIYDALFYRRTNRKGSCLVINQAVEELKEYKSEVLPRIEKVFTEVVAPVFECGSDHEFNGLTGLLGAYMVIGSKADPTNVVSFLRTLPVNLQANAVASVPIYFSRMSKQDGYKMPINDVLLTYVYEASISKMSTLQEAARRALTFLPE